MLFKNEFASLERYELNERSNLLRPLNQKLIISLTSADYIIYIEFHSYFQVNLIIHNSKR